ncbi:MAG TPA: MFS transporter [Actinomycetota bacterium]|nr:MFS transporter [Actinomycetota bacterium]
MTRVGLAVHRTFHAVAHSRNFRLFFVGQAVSVTGTWMQQVATAWLVLRLTGSGVALGLQVALNFGPILLFGLWGGLLADRLDKRRILVATQATQALLAAALWALVGLGAVELWMVYLLTSLQGLVVALDQPTRHSFFAEMVREEDLTNAVSLNSAVMTGTRIVGPALAGALISVVGLAPCFLANALSYLAVIGGLLAMRPAELRRPRGGLPVGGRVREGLLYVWRTPELRLPLAVLAAVSTLSFNLSVLFPLLAEGPLGGGASTFGLLLSAMGVGSLIGSLAMARLERPGLGRLGWAAVAFGLLSALAAWAPGLEQALLIMVPLGAASMVLTIATNSSLQLAAQPEMRGRVMALFGVVFLGSTPVGGPIAGWVAERLGPREALALGGAAAVVAGALGLWRMAHHGLALARVGRPRARPRRLTAPLEAAPADPELASLAPERVEKLPDGA